MFRRDNFALCALANQWRHVGNLLSGHPEVMMGYLRPLWLHMCNPDNFCPLLFKAFVSERPVTLLQLNLVLTNDLQDLLRGSILPSLNEGEYCCGEH